MSARVIPQAVVKPIDLIKQIQDLQEHLNNNVDWLSKSYGRVYKHQDKDRVIPVIYHKGNSYEEVLPDENSCFSFVQVENDSINFEGFFEDGDPSDASCSLSVVFWINTLMVYKNEDYRYDEKIEIIKNDCFQALNDSPSYLSLTGLSENYNTVFDGYEFEGETKQRLFKYPFYALKFDCKLNFDLCNTNKGGSVFDDTFDDTFGWGGDEEEQETQFDETFDETF